VGWSGVSVCKTHSGTIPGRANRAAKKTETGSSGAKVQSRGEIVHRTVSVGKKNTRIH